LGHWVAGRLDQTEFPADPAMPESRCFRSADRFLLRTDGMLVPLGRADRQVKINGIRVEPGDTEAALRKLPGVADAVVMAHGDPEAPVLLAFVAPAAAQARSARAEAQLVRDWRSALAELLPPQQVPARIRVVPAIPLLPSLKPDLATLRALPLDDAPGMLSRLGAWLRGAAR
jgi:acyl-coenzyme A synthetase/AMP-(fatty) acid ligase